ncbi:MAG: RNase adapter RapZ [Gammaproteobacteria bacterium]|nr:MAG: RNase adapter RapZ [Gammaproteobacteria bacterium]
MSNTAARLIVVSGLSGSGKSIALNVLEDAGFNCIDNLPLHLFETLAHDMIRDQESVAPMTAVGIDARAPHHHLGILPGLISDLRENHIHSEILFLEADTDILIQRFSETRRRHPLTSKGQDLEEAIARERQLLEPLRDAADLHIDTSRTNIHQLRELISGAVASRKGEEMSIVLKSFGFKHGMTRNANFVFDVRCLPNPHWHPELRPLTGKDEAVAHFLEQNDEVDRMFHDIDTFVQRWIPCFEKERRAYLTIAIGCTGGQHRSVYMAERLRQRLEEQGRRVLCRHRELA